MSKLLNTPSTFIALWFRHLTSGDSSLANAPSRELPGGRPHLPTTTLVGGEPRRHYGVVPAAFACAQNQSKCFIASSHVALPARWPLERPLES